MRSITKADSSEVETSDIERRMGIFQSKKLVWVPQNEKLKDKCEDVCSLESELWLKTTSHAISQAESWNAIENFVGWRIQNDGKILATVSLRLECLPASSWVKAMAKCDSCSVYDLSYNGLGDNEGKEIAKALKINFTKNEKPYSGVPGAKIYGTIVKLNLANNNLHAEGIRAICEALLSSNPSELTSQQRAELKHVPGISFSLEELGLANNAAGWRSSAVLAFSLGGCSGPEGAVEVAKVIASNRIIRSAISG
eukprot:762733-Hanusia_phi.AAC.3